MRNGDVWWKDTVVSVVGRLGIGALVTVLFQARHIWIVLAVLLPLLIEFRKVVFIIRNGDVRRKDTVAVLANGQLRILFAVHFPLFVECQKVIFVGRG